jgi:hypothetical protein
MVSKTGIGIIAGVEDIELCNLNIIIISAVGFDKDGITKHM